MKTILQIEDNRANRILVERILEPNPNYRLIQAEDGETGVNTALEEHPDLILLDMGLPDLDGQTIVTLLRQIPELKEVPIVAVTAWPEETAVEMAQRYGCDGCILKPINVKTFPDEVAHYLK